jgi:C-terminal processing protease CtpA/Prc
MRNIPARHAINATLQRISVNESERWMFQDVHQGGPAFAAGIRPGDLLLECGGREVRPPNDLTFSVGESADLLIEKLHGEVQKVNVQLPIPKSQKHPVTAPQAVTTDRLSDEIGLLRVAMFPVAIGIDVAKDIDREIAALDGSSRLIVDLRGNTGGGIGGLRLMSYLTPGKLEVGYSLTRKRRERGYRREELTRFGRIPSHKATLIWLAARYAFVEKSILVVTEGLGQRRFHGRVVLLVNEHTASAGEMVSAFAEENNLATIVGTKTPGRLLSGSAYKVGHGYILGLPVAAYLTWQGSTKPTISTIAPSTGQAGGVSPVAISGTGFGAGSTVNISPGGIGGVSGVSVSPDGTLINAAFNISGSAAVGPYSVTVSVPSANGLQTSNSVTFTVTACASFTNFQRQSWSAKPATGELDINYTWSASTGNQSDLAACQLAEYVTYPGSGGTYTWPRPPFGQVTANPTSGGGNGANSLYIDMHLPPASWIKPYIGASFQASQTYQYVCPCVNSGNQVKLGQYTITRSVTKNSDGTYKYTVTKSSGESATLDPLP